MNYTWDNANRLTQITQGSATVTIGYDNANRRTSLTLPNGIVAAYGYDAASRVTSITYTQGQTTIGNLTYTYDANGRRTSMGGSLARVNLPAAVSSATYNANNQLTNWNGTTLTYDLNGNLTNDGATGYTWDARNRLSAFGSTSFAYDSFGRRTLNPTGKSFVYDGLNTVEELSGSTVTANLLTGLGVDEIFTRTDSAGVRNFLTDALGSTLALTDSSGTTQTQYTYEPFGKTTSGGASNTSTFQYTGRENDGTGLYYYRARYYHPTLQRFISEDPARLSGGDVNFYAYVTESPTGLTDPLGEAGITRWGPDPFGPMLPDPPKNNGPMSPQRKPPSDDCGGGYFGFFGKDQQLGPLRVDAILLGINDTKTGLSYGSILGLAIGKFIVVGVESTRNVSTRQAHTTAIFLGGAEPKGTGFGGGFFWSPGQSTGWYASWGPVGGGAYTNLCAIP